MSSIASEKDIDFFYDCILKLKTREDCKIFFDDVSTRAELDAMSRRLLAAKLLKENHVFEEIREITGLSTTTISRVNRCLKYGDGGYERALN
jgi:TrpR-related protein YerC/YecD